jgi:hypothetical protein
MADDDDIEALKQYAADITAGDAAEASSPRDAALAGSMTHGGPPQPPSPPIYRSPAHDVPLQMAQQVMSLPREFGDVMIEASQGKPIDELRMADLGIQGAMQATAGGMPLAKAGALGAAGGRMAIPTAREALEHAGSARGLGFWEHRMPEAPVLKGDPQLRGSMNALDNIPFTYKGKAPSEWTAAEFKKVGDRFGVKNLGPETPAQAFRYEDGSGFNLPGGLDGTWTYYDLLRIKTDGIDPSRIPRDLHIKMQQKLMRTMTPDQPVSPEQIWSGLTFGITSPNNPLFPNQMTMSRMRLRDPAMLEQIAGAVPWDVGAQDISKEQRTAVSNAIAEMLGVQSGKAGGLGSRGSQDYSAVGEMAKLFRQNPGWFRKAPDEPWRDFVERLSSQVRGLQMKTGSFSGVWQDPMQAGVSAIDRHMVNLMEQHGRLFANDAERLKFEAQAVDRWNNAKGRPQSDRVQSYNQLLQKSGSEGLLNKLKLEYVGKAGNRAFRTSKGEINPKLPEHLRDFVVEPQEVNIMSEPYQRAQDWNAELAEQSGLGLFASQWMEWDRIRRRFEPHENMFPGLERMPAMSKDQLKGVMAEHRASEHMNYGKVAADEDASAVRSLQPTRRRENPARFAYFTAPPVAAGALGVEAMQGGEEDAGPATLGPAASAEEEAPPP